MVSGHAWPRVRRLNTSLSFASTESSMACHTTNFLGNKFSRCIYLYKCLRSTPGSSHAFPGRRRASGSCGLENTQENVVFFAREPLGARRCRSSVLRSRMGARNYRSSVLRAERALENAVRACSRSLFSARWCRSGVLRSPVGAQNGRSSVLMGRNDARNRRLGPLGGASTLEITSMFQRN